MEKSLSDPRMEASVMAKIGPKPPSSCSRRRFSPLSYKSKQRGLCIKASSFSAAKVSSEERGSLEDNRFLASEVYRLNGINGACSSLSLAEIYVLDATNDEYEGIIINPDGLPKDIAKFASLLRTSLSYWELKGKKGVWLKLPLDRSELVPIAIQEGFVYHHAEPAYVMLTYWLPDGPSLLPSNATHHVGVGGFVLNDKNEVLVVQEKYCSSSSAGFWKLPTGFILESEEIFSGAVREVKEETGIDTEFLEVIAFRHAHQLSFGKSDLFFICMLRPLSTQIEIDEYEIQAAKWMPLAEFVEQPSIQSDNMFHKIIDICIARLGKQYCGLAAHPVISKFDGRRSSLYYNVAEPQDYSCNCGVE